MAKLANLAPRGPSANITTSSTPDTFTREGAPGYTYDSKSQLFLLAVTNMVAEDTFYEFSAKRDDRYSGLVRAIAHEDPTWLLDFVTWLRGPGNIRTASIVAAVEAGEVLAGTGFPRLLLAAALQRADEPAEVVGYWHATRGRRMPSWLKRGLADAANRLYNPYSAFKYDTTGSPVRFADVIELADQRHLGLFDENRTALWGWLIDRRHGNSNDRERIDLPMVHARAMMNDVQPEQRALVLNPGSVAQAGHTWESIATWLGGPWTAHAWEAVIPSMGYMALLRNLRNFDEAGVSREVAEQVAARLSDPAQVARSRQLPMRFLSAYNAVTNDRWKVALGDALQHSLANVPKLEGRTAILIDTSGSMDSGFSKDGTLKRWDAAAVFGIALALANGEPGVLSFSNQTQFMATPAGSSLLNLVQQFQRSYFLNGGTYTAHALQAGLQLTSNRAVILTDEQAAGYGMARFGESAVPVALAAYKRTYTFNLAGYAEGMAPSGGSHYTVGGLTDAGFRMIDTIERGADQKWPWQD